MRSKYIRLFIIVYFLFSIFLCSIAFGQYGLEFVSHENEFDKRTSLCIGDKDPLNLSDQTKLTFDLQFKPYQQDYFGYIFRLIIDDKTNIDLIYDRSLGYGKHFKLIVGDTFTNINFDIPTYILYYNWSKIELVLDKKENKILFKCLNKTFEYKIDLKTMKSYKLAFGFNNYTLFQSSDLPPMRIKDVAIYNEKKLSHLWALDQTLGKLVKDKEGLKNAIANNPLWIKRLRQEWTLENDYYVSGRASFSFDPVRECVYVISEDSLVRTYLGTKNFTSWKYLKAPMRAPNGYQAILNPLTRQINLISIDQKIVSEFDTLTRLWSKDFIFPAKGTHYLSFNKFYSPKDSSYYMVAGYGHFQYNNHVHKYHLPSQTWDSLSFAGDSLFPHYLGALGTGKNGSIFLLGGYGSATGNQMLNPKVSGDLMKMDLQSREFKKISEVNFSEIEGVWANSLVFNDSTNTIYGLMFPKNKFKSSLQLISISPDGKEIKELGSTVPFDFHDIKSFADLYYSKASNKFVAVTMYFDTNARQSRVRIFTLMAPALPYLIDKGNPSSSPISWPISVLLALGIIGIILILILISRKRRHNFNKPMIEEPLFKKSILRDEPVEFEKIETDPVNRGSAIYLFRGDIQIFNKNGVEITKQFSKLLKELLSMFVVYTLYRGRGISSEKLVEIFWSDKSVSSATNNRSVNIAKINSLLEQLGDIKISKQSGYWSIENLETIETDLSDFLKLSKKGSSLNPSEVEKIISLLGNGGFMYESDYEWLDSIKDEISIHAIGLLSSLFHNPKYQDNPELIVEISNRIFHFDSVNEEAMINKCKALIHLGYHSLAHQCFETFQQVYQQLYAEPYIKDYKEII